MKHTVSLEKSDIVSMGPGIDYVLGEKEDVKGDVSHIVIKKGGPGLKHVRTTKFCGLPVNIEIDRGMTAEGVGPDGKKWRKEYSDAYGEIDRTLAQSDGDPVDVYLGPHSVGRGVPGKCLVYVVHQLKPNGEYDEDKCFLGFGSAAEAKASYIKHGPSWGFGGMDKMTLDEFKNGYLASNRDPKLIVKEHRSNG